MSHLIKYKMTSISANNTQKDAGTDPMKGKATGKTDPVPVKGEVKSIAEAQQELKRTIKDKRSWADIEEDADKAATAFKEMLDSSEFKQIFTALNSTLPEVRQGGMKSLITYMVKTTPLSKNDVKAVSKSYTPTTGLALRSAPPKANPKKPNPAKPKTASAKNTNQHRCEAELRALYPDYKSQGPDSEYAKMKRFIVDLHKQGKTIKVQLVRGVDALKALPTINLA